MSHLSPETAHKRRILVVDSQPIFRDGVRYCLNAQKDLVCCGEADDVASARKAVAAHAPELVLLDLRLKGEDGFELIKRLRVEHPGVLLLVVSQNDEMVFGDRSLRTGAHGYLMKDQGAGELVNAVRAVLKGEIYLSQRLSGLMLKKLWRGETSGDITSVLSTRELQVFQLLGSGVGTKGIARNLSLSIKTIETHREHIKRKLGLKDASSLIHGATMWAQSNPAPLAAPAPVHPAQKGDAGKR
jgi:DNA-binding NarL/FixJ family response regulator